MSKKHAKAEPQIEIPADILAMSFEAALDELEKIVAALDGGNLPLEEAITTYQRGGLLREHCDRLLRDAEMRVRKITHTDSDVPSAEPLDTDVFAPTDTPDPF